MTISVTIDGLTFWGDGSQSDWIYERLQGWYSSAPMRGDTDDRPASDGSFGVDKAYRSARPLRFIGSLVGDSPAQAVSEMWMRFAAIQSDGKPFPLTVTDNFGTLTCTVSLNGVAQVEEITDYGAAVDATFIAYDPVKYSAPRALVTGLPMSGGGLEYPLHSPSGALYYGGNGVLGRVSITNAGTAAVWPTVEVSGGLTAGFYIQRLDTGQIVRYDRVVPDGTTVQIDFRTGAVTVDNTSDASTYLTAQDFFAAGPGETFDVQFNAIGGSSGTPTMTLTISDGYW